MPATEQAIRAGCAQVGVACSLAEVGEHWLDDVFGEPLGWWSGAGGRGEDDVRDAGGDQLEDVLAGGGGFCWVLAADYELHRAVAEFADESPEPAGDAPSGPSPPRAGPGASL